MTPGTLISYGLFVYIRMAGITIGFSLRKSKRSMAIPARNILMLPHQRELCDPVIERNCFQINLPAIGFMAIAAVGFETGTVR